MKGISCASTLIMKKSKRGGKPYPLGGRTRGSVLFGLSAVISLPTDATKILRGKNQNKKSYISAGQP